MSKRVLVVDDQEGMREMIADFLAIIGFESCTVDGAEAALGVLDRGESVDLVITDLHMPVTDGLELMGEIHRRWQALPVVVITGYGTFRTERQVLESGAAGFIAKPCTLHRVQETVQAALGIAP